MLRPLAALALVCWCGRVRTHCCPVVANFAVEHAVDADIDHRGAGLAILGDVLEAQRARISRLHLEIGRAHKRRPAAIREQRPPADERAKIHDLAEHGSIEREAEAKPREQQRVGRDGQRRVRERKRSAVQLEAYNDNQSLRMWSQRKAKRVAAWEADPEKAALPAMPAAEVGEGTRMQGRDGQLYESMDHRPGWMVLAGKRPQYRWNLVLPATGVSV